MKYQIGPAMQWAKRSASKNRRDSHSSHRIQIDFIDAETWNVGAQSESENDIDEMPAQNLQSLQGSSGPSLGSDEDLDETESERPHEAGKVEDELSAWNYYSQQWE